MVSDHPIEQHEVADQEPLAEEQRSFLNQVEREETKVQLRWQVSQDDSVHRFEHGIAEVVQVEVVEHD